VVGRPAGRSHQIHRVAIDSPLDMRHGHHRLSFTSASSHSGTLLPQGSPEFPFDGLDVTDGTVAFSGQLTHLVHLLTQKAQRVLGCRLLRYAKVAKGPGSAL
jgi:hypothetical protein